MEDVLIRCDECKHLYNGDLEDTVEVYEVDVSVVGCSKPAKAPIGKHLCDVCKLGTGRRR